MSHRTTHALDQFLALALDVQRRLVHHRDDLIAAGWTPAEAWAFCQRVEERILGPAMDVARVADEVERTMEERVRAAVEEELRRRDGQATDAG